MGLVAGDEKLEEKVRRLLSGKGKEVGLEARKKLGQMPLQTSLAKALEAENDLRIKIWMRVKLMGESQVALARELGYTSNVAIHQIAKRVEEKSLKDVELRIKLKKIKDLLIVND